MSFWQIEIELSGAVDRLHAAEKRVKEMHGLLPDERRMWRARLASVRSDIESLAGAVSDASHFAADRQSRGGRS